MVQQNRSLRPTTGRVREALFDILRMKMQSVSFLDLYAGTGAVGLNALKEGACEVYFVEESKASCKKIESLVIKTAPTAKTVIKVKKVISFIEWAELESVSFDIIFLDPPYHTDEIFNAMQQIGSTGILKDNGTVVAEHFKKKDMPERFGFLCRIKEYHYGDTVLSIYEKKHCR